MCYSGNLLFSNNRIVDFVLDTYVFQFLFLFFTVFFLHNYETVQQLQVVLVLVMLFLRQQTQIK